MLPMKRGRKHDTRENVSPYVAVERNTRARSEKERKRGTSRPMSTTKPIVRHLLNSSRLPLTLAPLSTAQKPPCYRCKTLPVNFIALPRAELPNLDPGNDETTLPLPRPASYLYDTGRSGRSKKSTTIFIQLRLPSGTVIGAFISKFDFLTFEGGTYLERLSRNK